MKGNVVVDYCLAIYIDYRIDKLDDVCFVHPQSIEVVQDECHQRGQTTHTIQFDHLEAVVGRVNSHLHPVKMKVVYGQH